MLLRGLRPLTSPFPAFKTNIILNGSVRSLTASSSSLSSRWLLSNHHDRSLLLPSKRIFSYLARPVTHTRSHASSYLHRGSTALVPVSLRAPNNLYTQHHLGVLSYFSSWPGGSGRPSGGNRLAQGVGLAGAATVLFGKAKYLLVAAKVTKLSTLGSMVLTIGTYTMFFGLPFATGIVGLIFVHEMGHALVMMQRGIPFSPMVFLPFMGAVIAMNKVPRDAWEDALVAFGGPYLGSLGAVAVAVAAQSTGSQLLYALADFGFMINLFNLLPLGSMDGGRITGALSPYAGVAGLGFGGLMIYNGVIHNPLFYLIMITGGYETFQRFYNPDSKAPNYYKITPMQRGLITGGYFGLIAALILAMGVNRRNLKSPEVLEQEKRREMTFDMR